MAEAGAIRAGKAFVELFADDSRLVRTLRQAENRIRAFGAKIQSIGRRLATLGIAASIPFALSTKTFAGFDDQMRAVKAAVDRKTRFASRFDRIQLKRVRLPNRWIAIPCEFRYKAYLRFDAVKKEFYRLCANRRAFVRPGWRILATNILNGEQYDFGFMDADTENPALADVYLPDGEYEISVLTSSLFWKDCLENRVRSLSIRPDGLSPLPTIYNLRSSVSEGVTTIRWSANRSELNDCVFGVWYSSESPVDVNRPPDQTAWYFPSQTEYATIFSQNAPAWVAVAAMRTGDKPENGKVHELYLDWSNVPPRAPDDVMVLDTAIPAIDMEVETRHEDDPFTTLWNG